MRCGGLIAICQLSSYLRVILVLRFTWWNQTTAYPNCLSENYTLLHKVQQQTSYILLYLPPSLSIMLEYTFFLLMTRGMFERGLEAHFIFSIDWALAGRHTQRDTHGNDWRWKWDEMIDWGGKREETSKRSIRLSEWILDQRFIRIYIELLTPSWRAKNPSDKKIRKN